MIAKFLIKHVNCYMSQDKDLGKGLVQKKKSLIERIKLQNIYTMFRNGAYLF